LSVSDYIDNFGPEGVVAPGTKLEGTKVSLAGRIHNIRASGAKLKFYDLHGEGKKVQIMATQQYVQYQRLLDQSSKYAGMLTSPKNLLRFMIFSVAVIS